MSHKEAAVDFLKKVVAGDIEAAYAKYVDMGGKHHNPFTPAGMPALKKGMMENDKQFPNKQFEVLRVLEDGDLVSVYSRLSMGDMLLAVNHSMRFKNGKVVEFWDYVLPVTKDLVNQDGLF